MGSVFAQHALDIPNPRVGLLSNGQEETKGNELTRKTHAILKTLDLNYLGYVEGTDLYNGTTEVVVTDGFVGNVALKVSEGVAELLIGLLKDKIGRSARGKDGLPPPFRRIQGAFQDRRLLRVPAASPS